MNAIDYDYVRTFTYTLGDLLKSGYRLHWQGITVEHWDGEKYYIPSWRTLANVIDKPLKNYKWALESEKCGRVWPVITSVTLDDFPEI